jgi:DNA-directed RNA polymerase subunit RPC12/RpoP
MSLKVGFVNSKIILYKIVGGLMGFKRIKCPICGQKVSFFWNYFISRMIYTCSNCKTRIQWHPIVGLYSVIFGIIMFSIFFILKNYITPPYIAMIIASIPAYIIFLIIPKKVKTINKDKEKKI